MRLGSSEKEGLRYLGCRRSRKLIIRTKLRRSRNKNSTRFQVQRSQKSKRNRRQMKILSNQRNKSKRFLDNLKIKQLKIKWRDQPNRSNQHRIKTEVLHSTTKTISSKSFQLGGTMPFQHTHPVTLITNRILKITILTWYLMSSSKN
jgi:hypothetical protein